MPILSPNWMVTGAKTKQRLNTSSSHKTYSTKVCQAITGGLKTWQMMAYFKDIKIMGPTAIGAPGCLHGPAVGPLVLAGCPQRNEWERKTSKAVAGAVGEVWADFQRSVTIPGLPWYPSFTAVPGPMAPPTPNVPMPFAVLPQNRALLRESYIRDKIEIRADPKGEDVSAAYVAILIAAGFASTVPAWLMGLIVKNVLGKGPVPSFAPPYVPVGPVVMGDNLPIPGHLA